jgi:hypothetical protein
MKSCVLDSEISLAVATEVTKRAPARHNIVSLLKHKKAGARGFFHPSLAAVPGLSQNLSPLPYGFRTVILKP